MEFEGLSPRSQALTASPCPDPHHTSPFLPIPVLEDPSITTTTATTTTTTTTTNNNNNNNNNNKQRK
jgi:hypothetical protein